MRGYRADHFMCFARCRTAAQTRPGGTWIRCEASGGRTGGDSGVPRARPRRGRSQGLKDTDGDVTRSTFWGFVLRLSCDFGRDFCRCACAPPQGILVGGQAGKE